MMSSVYAGADTAPTRGRVLAGSVCGLPDGAVAGWLFGWLYRDFDGTPPATASKQSGGGMESRHAVRSTACISARMYP